MTQMQSAPLTIDEDQWLSVRFGHPVFRVTARADTAETSRIADCLLEHQPGLNSAMYYAKVDTSHVALVSQLESAGMNLVDTNVTLSQSSLTFRTRRPDSQRQATRCVVQTATLEDELPVLEIAASCFRSSRFHLDPAVPNGVADQIKHDWIKSYVDRTRGDRLFVALHEGRPAGFLAALTTGANSENGVIDLIGVSDQAQRRGVGHSLVTAFLDHYWRHCDVLRVGTQVTNTASLVLYQKAGFRISGSSYVLHKHVP